MTMPKVCLKQGLKEAGCFCSSLSEDYSVRLDYTTHRLNTTQCSQNGFNALSNRKSLYQASFESIGKCSRKGLPNSQKLLEKINLEKNFSLHSPFR